MHKIGSKFDLMGLERQYRGSSVYLACGRSGFILWHPIWSPTFPGTISESRLGMPSEHHSVASKQKRFIFELKYIVIVLSQCLKCMAFI